MGYATAADLASRLGSDRFELIYDPSDPSVADADLAAASAVVDGYLARRYAVPVTATSALPLLSVWTLDIASELGYLHTGGAEMPEKIKDRAETARKALRDVADGNMMLPADAAALEAGKPAMVLAEGDPPLLTRPSMSDY